MKVKNRYLKAYDALMTIAMALNASVMELSQLQPPRGLDKFSYSDGEMARVFWRNILKTDFFGLTVSCNINNYINHHNKNDINVNINWSQFNELRL